MVVSCGKAAETGIPAEDGQVRVSTRITTVETRTWLDSGGGGDNLKVYWSNGDRINVNGQNSSPLSVEDGEKVTACDFLLRSVLPPYNVIYPAEIVSGAAYDSEGRVEITIPSVQQYTPGSFGCGSAILYGWSEDAESAVPLRNLCSAIRVKLWTGYPSTIEEVSLQSATTPVAGRYSLRPQDGSLTVVEGSNNLSLALGEGVALSAEGEWFYFTVPAGEYADSLTFTFIQKEDRRSMKCTWTPKGPLDPGILYSFSNVEYVPGAKDIETPDDWNEFAAAIAGNGDVRKWVRNGVVNLGADLNADDLDKVPADFSYVFEGHGHTITRSAATGALFSSVNGTVRNLNLSGALSTDASLCSSLADYLYAGGKIESCTSSVTIVNDASGYVRAGGFVGVMNGGTIRACTNTGSINAIATAAADTYNMQVGGIVAQIDVSDTEHGGDALLENCKNAGAITADPSVESNDFGFNYSGVGGIAGWLRGQGHSFTLVNCDNEGAVTYSAEHVTSTNGARAYAICAGGIVGIAGDLGAYPIYTGSSQSNLPGVFSSFESGGSYYTGTDTGLDVSLTDCDNTGTVYNCGDNYSAKLASNNKVYTGGIAGSLVGTAAQYARLSYCTNTGTLLTYDLTGENASLRPIYCQVVGGLIGYGGYVSADNCTVNCTIGNGKRQANAIAGAIGYAMRPFSVSQSLIWFTGYFVRVSNNNTHSASIAVVPLMFGTGAETPIPTITGSSVTNTKCGAKLYYANASSETSTDDYSASMSSTTLNSTSSLVRGKGYSSAATDVAQSGNSNQTSAP